MLTLAGAMAWKAQTETKGAIRVTGEVSGFDRTTKGLYSARYRATVDGQEVYGNSVVAKSWESPPVGTKVELYYCAGKERPLVERGIIRYVAPLVLALVSVPLFVGAAMIEVEE